MKKNENIVFEFHFSPSLSRWESASSILEIELLEDWLK